MLFSFEGPAVSNVSPESTVVQSAVLDDGLHNVSLDNLGVVVVERVADEVVKDEGEATERDGNQEGSKEGPHDGVTVVSHAGGVGHVLDGDHGAEDVDGRGGKDSKLAEHVGGRLKVGDHNSFEIGL